MRFTVLGSSGSSPARGNPGSGYLIECAGTAIQLDAGPGTFAELSRHMDPADLDALIVSHIHVDHGNDVMAFFAYLAHGEGRGKGPLPVYVPAGAADYYATVARATEAHPFFHVLEMRTVGAGDAVTVGSLRCEFAEGSHSVPAICTRIEGGGQSIVFSGDTGPGGGLEALAASAGVLLCEATYQEATKDTGYPYHLSAAEAGEMASRADVEALFLTHLGPSLDADQSAAEAREVFAGRIEVARPGMVVELTVPAAAGSRDALDEENECR